MSNKYLKDFYWRDYANILLGLLLYAVGLVGFIKQAGIVTGGLTGVGLLVEYATSGRIPLQVTYFVVNCLLLLSSLKILGVKFLLKTIFSVIILTALISLCQMFFTEPIIKNEPMMSGVIGAMLCGAGIGLVFNANGSTGGTDIVVAVLNKYKNMAFGRAMLFCDFVIICSSFFVFRDYIKIIYGLLVMGVMTYVIDMVINGFRQSVQFLIISKKYELIADVINHEMNRGCTVLDGTGWYSKEPTKVLMVLARRSEAAELFRAIKTIDNDAFISQSVVKGVFGKGFDRI